MDTSAEVRSRPPLGFCSEDESIPRRLIPVSEDDTQKVSSAFKITLSEPATYDEAEIPDGCTL